MALIEAVLTYRPHGLGGDGTLQIGRTSDPMALRAVRECLRQEASREAEFWRDLDPGLAAMKSAEAQRLAQVLEFLTPEEELQPGLRLVDEEQ